MSTPFWGNVKRVMKEKSLTQQDLADYLQLSLRTVQGWFHKDIDFNLEGATAIAKFLNVSLDELVGLDDIELRDDELQLLNLYNKIPEEFRNIAILQVSALLPLKDMN